MNDLYSLSAQVARLAPLASSVSKHFAGRPTLQDAARQVLTMQLALLYPDLAIDPARLELLAPIKDPGTGRFGGYHRTLMIDALMRRYLVDENILLIPDYHLLTHEGGAEQPGALAVDIKQVQRIVNEWGPQLLNVHGQALCDYWNVVQLGGGNRWKWLAVWLQTRLKRCVERDHKAGALDQDQAATAMALVTLPDALHRRQYSGDALRASLIGLRPAGDDAASVAQVTHALVIQRHVSLDDRDVVLLYTPLKGIEAFASLDALAVSVAKLLPPQFSPSAIRLALFEPDESVFEVQAKAILAQQLAAVQAVGARCRAEASTVSELERQVERVTCLFEVDTAEEVAELKSVEGAVPQWLLAASGADRRAYSLHLADLAVLRQQQGGRVFTDGIASIMTFARQALSEAVAKAHPQAPATLLDDVQVHILTLPDAPMSIVDGGHRTMVDQTISLVQLAVMNLAGRPRGHLIVEPRQGATLPAWVDTAAIEALVTRVDVGGAYISMLRARLRDNEVEAAGRKSNFTAQLAIQLPMLALENKIRQQQGFTERGQRLVAQVLAHPQAASVDGHAVSMKTLGFKAAANRSPDRVQNMFVMGAVDGTGTQVLYRPLFTPALMEFDSGEALLDAIAEPGALQDSVVDWLEPATRKVYAQGGFKEPHVARFGLGSDAAVLEPPAPVRLSLAPMAGPLLAGLYEQSVEALITVARRQSLSSEQSRWINYQALAWTLFNALLPVFSGPLATAGWMIQAITSLGIALDARVQGKDEAVTDTLADLFFNVALVLLTRGISRGPWIKAYPEPLPVTMEPLAASRFDVRPVQASQVTSELSFSWSRANHRLTREDLERLMGFEVAKPATLGEPVPHGALQGLYQDGQRWLVSLDGHFFQVSLDEGQARIVDTARPELPGPWLERDEVHRWRLDLSLRLRGGSPKRNIEQQRAQNLARKLECGRIVSEFNATRTEMNVKVNVLIRKVGVAAAANDLALVQRLRERLSAETEPYLASLRRVLAVCIELKALDPGFDRSRDQAELLGFLHLVGTEELINLRMRSRIINNEAEPLGMELQAQHVDPAQSRLFFDFVQRSSDLTEKQVRLTKEVRGWKKQLERLPLEGDRVLKTLTTSYEIDLPVEYWIGLLIDGLGLLCVRHIPELPVASRLVDSVVSSARLAALSHAELQQSAHFTLNDRVEVLDSVEQQYAAALDALADYRTQLGAQLDLTAMGRLEGFIAELRASAKEELVPLVKEQEKMTRKQRRSERNVNLFVTARRGVVVGKRRTTSAGATAETFEMVDPIESKVLAAFEKDPVAGTWTEVQPDKSAAAPLKSLNSVVNKSQGLLKAADKEVLSAWRQAAKPYIPSEVEDQLLSYARQLNDHADAIDRQLTLRNETDLALPAHQSAETRAKELRDKAAQLTEEGRLIRIDMSKRQPPTVARVDYLLRQKAIRIRRIGERKALKKGRDFMQEYEVADLEGAPLWYAHFHYAQARGLASAYERAHLKTASQRLDGLSRQMAQDAAGEEVIAILRSRIEAPLDHLFLDLEPEG